MAQGWEPYSPRVSPSDRSGIPRTGLAGFRRREDPRHRSGPIRHTCYIRGLRGGLFSGPGGLSVADARPAGGYEARAMLETRCPAVWLTLCERSAEKIRPSVNSQILVSVEHVRHSGNVHWRSCSTRYRTYCKTSRSRASVTIGSPFERDRFSAHRRNTFKAAIRKRLSHYRSEWSRTFPCINVLECLGRHTRSVAVFAPGRIGPLPDLHPIYPDLVSAGGRRCHKTGVRAVTPP
jgi:hypothetical protein